MSKKITRIIACLVILIGIGLMCYPSFANFIDQQFQNKLIKNYDNDVNNLSEEEIENTLELAKAYNASLPVQFPADPFTGKNVTDFTGTEFENFSMVQDGEMLGYVEIPTIDVYLPMYYGTSEDVLQKGAGLVENTSLPVGGSGTHAVISAHTGLASKKFFTDLTEVEEGDIFFIHVLNMDLAYQIDQIKVVLPDDVEDLQIVQDEDYVTLLTCTPFGINDHRLLVRGKRIDYDFAKDTVNQTVTLPKEDIYFWMLILGIFGIVIVVVHLHKKKKRNDADKISDNLSGGTNEK